MIKKITNFVNYENKGYFGENELRVIRFENDREKYFECHRERFEELVSYFDKLIEMYPEVLADEQIKKDSERLIAYCKEKGFAYKDTYSYIHKKIVDENADATIGLKVSNMNYYNADLYDGEKVVDIVYYDYDSSEVFTKMKLRFALQEDRIRWRHLIYEDCWTSSLYESDTLEFFKPNTYIKKQNRV